MRSSTWRSEKNKIPVKPLYEVMKAVEDPRSSRAKKHELAAVLTYLVIGYVTGHTTLRRCLRWCQRKVKYLKKNGLPLPNGIASLSTVSRLLSNIDFELFLFTFVEWVGTIVNTKGTHLAVDGKAIRAAAEKCKGKRAPMMLHVLDVATGLVVAQLPIPDKESEITNIPKLLSYLDIQGSTVTADALNTQTSVMEQIVQQGGHFVMMLKKNHPSSYDEIVHLFEKVKADVECSKKNPLYKTQYPEILAKYDEVAFREKNRDRYEYRAYRIINDISYLSKAANEWPFLKSIGYVEQVRILCVRDEYGNDITPSKEAFLREGSTRQPSPERGDKEKDDIQIVGIVSDQEMTAEEMGNYKRKHWAIENRLHHVLDDTFREDRSPAKKSANNLAIIRKFAFNVLKLIQLNLQTTNPISELMDLLNDDEQLLEQYVFREVKSFY